MRLLILAAAALVAISSALAQMPDIGTIMTRVAINQAKSMEERRNYVYTQKQLLRFVRGNGKMAREERREYSVAPVEQGVHKTLAKFEGKYERKGAFFAYDQPGYEYKDLDIDGDLINDMSNDMLSDDQGKDGISPDLFPLASQEQLKYNFRLIKAETYRGRDVYRVAFEPKPHHRDNHGDNHGNWKGEALIDAAEFQPILVTTKLAWGMPLVVKTLLGTNIKGLGFSVSYEKFADGVWFPVSYGGEFDVRAVFFYKRIMAISMVNTDFRRTDVKSEIAYATENK
jgi:hypothetical protein